MQDYCNTDCLHASRLAASEQETIGNTAALEWDPLFGIHGSQSEAAEDSPILHRSNRRQSEIGSWQTPAKVDRSDGQGPIVAVPGPIVVSQCH